MLNKVAIFDADLETSSCLVNEFEKTSGLYAVTVVSGSYTSPNISHDNNIVLCNMCAMPTETDGVNLTAEFRDEGFAGSFYIYNGVPSPCMVFRAALAGADAYILDCDTCYIVSVVEKRIRTAREHSEKRLCGNSMTLLIEQSAYLKSAGLSDNDVNLLGHFAEHGFPRLKEFSEQVSMSETSLWKRFARIREKLKLDSLSQIAHLLTSLSLMESSRERDSLNSVSFMRR